MLSSLRSMRGHEIYDLVSRSELLRAASYYRKERVRRFTWSDDGQSLCAYVKGHREYEVEFVLDELGSHCHCDCPAFGQYSPTCKHTVAALMTLCHALDPSRFRPPPFSERTRETLASQLLETDVSSGDAEEKASTTVTLRRGGNGSYTVDTDAWRNWNARRVTHWVDALYYASGKKRDELLLEHAAVPDGNTRLFIEVGETTCEIEGVLDPPLSWVVELDAGEEAVSIRLFLDGAGGARKETFVQCSERLVLLLPEHSLARATNAGLARAYGEFRQAAGLLDEDDEDSQTGFSPERVLEFPYALYSDLLADLLSKLASKKGARLLARGRPARLKTDEAKLCVHIESDAKPETHRLRISSSADGLDLEWHEEIDLLESSKNSFEYPGALCKSKPRRLALRNAEDEIYLAPNCEGIQKIVQAVSRQETFRKVRCGRAAGLYLNRLARFVHANGWTVRAHAMNDGPPGWTRVRQDLLPVAQLKALARRAFEVDEEDGAPGVMMVENRSLARGLGAFAALCRERDVPVFYNRAPLRTARLDISVQVERASEIDWFELRPEVTAEGLRIEQSRWEQLVRGELFEHADGGVLIFDVDSVQALQRIHALLGRGPARAEDEGSDAARVPRLRILDWLDLERAGVTLNLPKADQRVLNSLRRFRGVRSIGTPATLNARLRPYQQDGLDWLAFLYRHRFGACLADDMGLGKTVQAIALLAALKEGKIPGTRGLTGRRPHLIVVPPSLLYNWQQEIERFCPALRAVEYTGPDRTFKARGGDIVITTYELVRRDIKRLSRKPFDVVIFDETQQLKNEASRRRKAAQQLEARFLLCLTGTPLENHVGEYFTIMDLALPGLLDDARPFAKALRSDKVEQYVRRTHPFILRRTKGEILKDLPPKQESDVYLTMTEYQKELYTRTVGEVREDVLRAYADKAAAQAGIVALSALTRLRQICVSPALLDPEVSETSPKLQHLRAKLLELAEENHAALVFSQFTRALDLIEPVLEEAGIAFTRLDGKTSLAQRKKRIAAFQHREGPPVFLVSLKAGGVGLNLTRATYVFHVDPWWNPAVETQASDRAHRIGQRRKVMVNRILMHHTIEEKLMDLKKRKMELFKRVLEARAPRSRSALLSKTDFDFLLG